MAKILRSPRSAEDLFNIWIYISEHSERQADRTLANLRRRIELLGGRPYLGRTRNEIVPGLRTFVSSPFIILYTIVDDGIRIVRVVHESESVESWI